MIERRAGKMAGEVSGRLGGSDRGLSGLSVANLSGGGAGSAGGFKRSRCACIVREGDILIGNLNVFSYCLGECVLNKNNFVGVCGS